jgi:hypothetical protein
MIPAFIYFVGVLIGLVVMRDPWPVRLGTAAVWPLGPAAFVVVMAVLLGAALVLWPLLMVPVALLTGALFWWLA